MKPPFVLIPDSISNDMIECTKQLHQQALRGELIGLAFAGMIKRRGYIVNSAGEAHRSPTFARGMLLSLDDQLSTRVRGGNS